MSNVDISAVKSYLLGLQQTICNALQELDGGAQFMADEWQREAGGGGLSRVLAGGSVIEKGGVNFSHVMGDSMPASATAHRPELAGRSFQAMGVSLVIHPRNPYVWWFGGGYDLTPYYGNQDDCRHWHAVAKAACDPFGDDLHPRLKTWCDEYFYIPHRKEARGVGGLFFDDLNDPDFDTAFAIMQSVGDSYLKAYGPIIERRKDTPYGERQRDFQLHRRGRYVEFNLVYDRGTLFGLQTGGRTESILMSLPSEVRWSYDYQIEKNSEEALLERDYLPAKDWLE